MNNRKQLVTASLLDRLIDNEPETMREALKSRHQILTELFQSVRRDLENLLNTRASTVSWPKQWKELNHSLFRYGIADFMRHELGSAEAQKRFCADLTHIIRVFEPRFKSVKVELLQQRTQKDRTLRLRIEGLLHVEPVPEPVVFDSIIQPEINHIVISES